MYNTYPITLNKYIKVSLPQKNSLIKIAMQQVGTNLKPKKKNKSKFVNTLDLPFPFQSQDSDRRLTELSSSVIHQVPYSDRNRTNLPAIHTIRKMDKRGETT